MKNAKTTETKEVKQSSDKDNNSAKVFEPADYDKLRDTITGLDPADDSHWNQAGWPDMNYLKESMGRVITKENIETCGAGKWTRDVAQEMADKKAAEAAEKEAADKKAADDAGSGTDHLEGEAVNIIADGVVEGHEETELERQERERKEAREKRLQNEATGANIHDEKSLKVSEQAKALQALDKKKAKKEKQEAKAAAVEEEKRKAAHAELIAVEPSLGEIADPDDGEARFDNLERVAMTLVKVLLDMPLSPILRSKVMGCDKLIRNLSDKD